MRYLKIAQDFAEASGDEFWFANLYTGFREYNSVADSVWKTLSYLYGNAVADAGSRPRNASRCDGGTA